MFIRWASARRDFDTERAAQAKLIGIGLEEWDEAAATNMNDNCFEKQETERYGYYWCICLQTFIAAYLYW